MTVQNVGIALGDAAPRIVGSYARVSPIQGGNDMVVGFETDYGRPGKSLIAVSVNWRTATKGGGASSNDGFGAWAFDDARCVYSFLDPTGVACRQLSSGKWLWNVSLKSLTTRNDASGAHTTVPSAFEQLFGTRADFDTRKYDAIQLRCSVRVYYVADAQYSEFASAETTVWFVPEYTITGIGITRGGSGSYLSVTYDVSDSWTRAGDRFAFYFVKSLKNDESLLPYLYTPDRQDALDYVTVWGTVGRRGYMTVPLSSLTRIPDQGENIRVGIRVVAALAPRGLLWGKMIGDSSFSVSGPSEGVNASIALSDEEEPRHVIVTASGDGSAGGKAERFGAKLVGGHWACDVAEADVGSTAHLYFPPLDQDFYVQVWGYSGSEDDMTYSASAPKTYGPYRFSSRGADNVPLSLVQDAAAPEVAMAARYNVDRSWAGALSSSVVQLNGRSRPSAFFGYGSEVKFSLDFDLHPLEDSYTPGKWAADEGSLRGLLSAGVCIVRLPGGMRHAVALSQVSYRRDHDKAFGSVSVDAQEVDYGG